MGRAEARVTIALALALTTCVVAAGPSAPAALAQEEIPVTLRAKVFRYNRTTRVLVAEGAVVVTYQDIVIHADRLRANLGTNDVRAEGNVRLEVGRQVVRGSALDYNLDTRKGRISQAAADYTGPMVLGKVFVRAEVIEGVMDSTTVARDAVCTTCEGPTPVAYLVARELTLYPNDKIIGRSVQVWIGGRRIVTWPYFVIYIREQRASRLFPVVGYSETEGYFVKLFYSYALNNNHYGYLRLDLMERLGTGYGVEHAYRLDRGSGVAFLYHLDNKQTKGTDSRILLNHQQWLGDVSTRVFTDYVLRSSPEAPSTSFYTALDAYYRGFRSSTTLYQTYFLQDFPDIVGAASMAYTGRLFHTQQLTNRLSAEISAEVSRTVSALGTDDELLPRLTLRYSGSGYSASLVAEGRFDLDGSIFLGDLRFVTERLPELTVIADPRLIGKTRLVYQLKAGLGRFREGTSFKDTIEAARADLTATISGPLLESPKGFLNLFAQVRGSYYTTGDARGFLSGRLDYTRSLSEAWQGQIGLSYQDHVGQTPFVFDSTAGRLAQADFNLTYRRQYLTATVTTSFDMAAGQLAPVVARAQYYPRPGWTAAAALSYDPALGALSRAEVGFDIKLSPIWQLAYYGYYDGYSGRVFHDRLTITRTWDDCLAAAATYRGGAQEIWLEAWLTALPWARGRVGVGSQGQLLFEQPWLGTRP